MPLFGSSKKEAPKSQPQAYGTPYGSQPYPQHNPYPQGSSYPQAPGGGYPAQPTAPQGFGYPNEAPPPYAPGPPQTQPPPQYQNAYPTASAYPGAYQSGAPPMYQQTPQTVYVAGALDSGARVGPMSSQAVPPPPPGCPPNQAQMAAAQGHNVVLGQRQDNWFTGGEGGGYTWW